MGAFGCHARVPRVPKNMLSEGVAPHIRCASLRWRMKRVTSALRLAACAGNVDYTDPTPKFAPRKPSLDIVGHLRLPKCYERAF